MLAPVITQDVIMPMQSDAPDELVPDPQVGKELNISSMTIWRWDRDPEMVALGWPPPVYIRKRKYRGRKLLEKFKSAAVRRAIKTRNEKVA
jgi:hypothetical protein